MAMELVELLVGQAPQGFEYLTYIAAVIIAMFTIKFIYGLITLVNNFITKLYYK